MPIDTSFKTKFFSPHSANFAPLIALAIAVFAAYANMFGNEFVFDDALLIKGNGWLQGWGHIKDILTGSTVGGVGATGGFYRPLQILLYLLMHHLGGGGTFWFHELNFVLHLLNTLLLFKIGGKLSFDPKGAFFAALLWGVHPIHTEAVTYMSGTADPLMTLFVLWAFFVLLPDFTPKKILAVVPLFLLGLASKETAVVFPALVSVGIFCRLPNPFRLRTHLRAAPLWIIGIAYAFWRSNASWLDGPKTYTTFFETFGPPEMVYYLRTPLCRLYTFFSTLPGYAELLAWPTHLHMERHFPIKPEFLSVSVVLGFAMSVLAALFVARACKTGKRKELAWGFLWFAAAHAPGTGFFGATNALFLEHWMYLPSIGLFLGLGHAAAKALEGRSRTVSLAALAAVSAFALTMVYKTHEQNKVWKTPVSLYTNVFDNGEVSPRAYDNLGLYYADIKEFDKAIDSFHKAIAVGDVYPEPRFNLGITYLLKGQTDKNIDLAIENFKKAIEIQPAFYRAYEMLAEIYAFRKDAEQALYYSSRAKELAAAP